MNFLSLIFDEFPENPVGFVFGIVLIIVLTPIALVQLGKLISMLLSPL